MNKPYHLLEIIDKVIGDSGNFLVFSLTSMFLVMLFLYWWLERR